MKVFLAKEEKVIEVPPDSIPKFYTDNKWQLIFSDARGMYVTAPPTPKPPEAAEVPGVK